MKGDRVIGYLDMNTLALIRQTGGKLFKYSVTWEGKYYRFEKKRDAIAFLEMQKQKGK